MLIIKESNFALGLCREDLYSTAIALEKIKYGIRSYKVNVGSKQYKRREGIRNEQRGC